MAKKTKKDLWWYLNQQYGLPALKRKFTKKTGIPTTQAGIERKVGSTILDWLLGLFGIDKKKLKVTKDSTKTTSTKKSTTKKTTSSTTKKTTSTGSKTVSTGTKTTSTGSKTVSTGTKTTSTGGKAVSTGTRKTTTTTTGKSRRKSSLMGDDEFDTEGLDAPETNAPATE